MKENSVNAPSLGRSAWHRLHMDGLFGRLANRKIGSMAENNLLPVILQIASRFYFFEGHVIPPLPTQRPQTVFHCLQSMVKTVKHGIWCPSQTSQTALPRRLLAAPLYVVATPPALPLSNPPSPLVCLVLAQASSSTLSALPTPHWQSPSPPAQAVEKSPALGCLLDLFFSCPQSDLFRSQM